jgi:hypothetical protein
MHLGGLVCIKAATLDLNNAFYLASLSNLSAQATATNCAGKRASFLEFQRLAAEAVKDSTLAEEVRLSVVGGAAKSCHEYLWSVPTDTGVNTFIGEQGSNILSFLALALRTFDQTPQPAWGTMNVMTPLNYQGPSSAGMAPGNITDPECRAEYEESIAENRKIRARREAWYNLQGSIARCFWGLKCMIEGGSGPEKAKGLTELVKGSQLAERMKAALLSDAPRSFHWQP